jgi:NTF2 fold immunity protein of polymorphic toxin system component
MKIRWMFAGILLLAASALSSDLPKNHRDYVPDEKTAQRIAEAILVGQYGEEWINSQSPLLVDSSNKQYWIVQVSGGRSAPPAKGGGPAVWINRHSGCIQVIEHMK